MAKLTQAERTANRLSAKIMAENAEQEMLAAHAEGDADNARMWRGIADVAWSSVEDGEPVY